MLLARDYRTGQPIEVHIKGDRIAAVAYPDAAPADLPFVAPGLIDVQINGYGGLDFDSDKMSPDRWAATVKMQLARGVTTFLPTFCTNSREGFIASLTRYRQVVADPMLSHVMPGVHIEGPYISSEDGPRGAHNRAYTRNPSIEEFDAITQAAGGRVTILTLAPEREGAVPFIRELARRGVIVSIAHTDASREQIEAAVAAGARFSTHLGNGGHVNINRHRNYLYDQLADDRLWASVIPDSHHVPRALFNIILRTKGLDRVVLVSDASGLAGLAPGVYGHCEILPSGRLQLVATPAIMAGSSIALDFGVGKAVQMAGLTLAEAIDLASAQPAKLVGLADRGRLDVGAVADLILFKWDAANCTMAVQETYVQGRKV
ncbi:MAG: amidohydrolase family protein [Phycisphaerae bacterium]|nr:amidohydrolase family protein [Phycisphaerae bacterium]